MESYQAIFSKYILGKRRDRLSMPTLPIRDRGMSPISESAFGGAIETRILSPETNENHRAFAFEVTFHLHLWPESLRGKKPPLHFHPLQEEYIQVLQGRLCVEDDLHGLQILKPADGEFCIKPWTNHRLYPVEEPDAETPTRFFLAGQEVDEAFKLDLLFFENWYAYQEETVAKGKSVHLVQVMSIFDAGGSYLSLPRWLPFGHTLAITLGIVVGRWIGGALGYQPFYRGWTSDWPLACEKMSTSLFQRRFTDRAHSQ